MRASNGNDIKAEILTKRLERMAAEGPAFGHPVPETRQVPLVPFGRTPLVICEVKRRSPSRGDISPLLDAVAQARHYAASGVRTVSVLTEEDYFKGSLKDLMDVKNAFPELCVLRKDFLATEADLEVSWKAGADAVLLIASLLDADKLHALFHQSQALGLEVFMEIHSQDDADKVRALSPIFTGINSRNLADFSIDRALPLFVRPFIDWPSQVIYESGIHRREEAEFASAAGFAGILVGEAAVRQPQLAQELVQSFQSLGPDETPSFWARLMARKKPGRPLVKICGLTNQGDVFLADKWGCDVLGFVMAPSPRRVGRLFIESLEPTQALRVAVVTLEEGEDLPQDIELLLENGQLDAVQLHGSESPALVDKYGLQAYKALRIQDPADLDLYSKALAPRILVDAFVPTALGGTGQRIPAEILNQLRGQPLWLAGGLNPENIGEIIRTYQPELIDASSGLESAPGQKDPQKLNQYFREIENAHL